MPQDASDEELMMRYQRGDAVAFEQLYGRHKGALYRYLLRQSIGRVQAEELFQDCWLGLIRTIDRYRPDAPFRVYLFRIAHNQLVDTYRRNRVRASAASARDPAEVGSPPSMQPERRAETSQALSRLQTLVAALPDPQRDAFLLREEGGLSVEEIADATGVNRETAKSRLRYAFARLRQGLDGYL